MKKKANILAAALLAALLLLLFPACGHEPVTKTVLVMDTDHVILSAITPEAIARRLQDKCGEVYCEEEEQ